MGAKQEDKLASDYAPVPRVEEELESFEMSGEADDSTATECNPSGADGLSEGLEQRKVAVKNDSMDLEMGNAASDDDGKDSKPETKPLTELEPPRKPFCCPKVVPSDTVTACCPRLGRYCCIACMWRGLPILVQGPDWGVTWGCVWPSVLVP